MTAPEWRNPLLRKKRYQLPGKRLEARRDRIADGQSVVAMGHHAKSLGAIDQQDIVGHVRARLGRGGAADQRGRIDPAFAAGTRLARTCGSTCGAEGAV